MLKASWEIINNINFGYFCLKQQTAHMILKNCNNNCIISSSLVFLLLVRRHCLLWRHPPLPAKCEYIIEHTSGKSWMTEKCADIKDIKKTSSEQCHPPLRDEGGLEDFRKRDRSCNMLDKVDCICIFENFSFIQMAHGRTTPPGEIYRETNWEYEGER